VTPNPQTSCPTPDALERALADGPLGGDLKRHVDDCATCRAQAEQITENLAFMRGMLDRLGPDALSIARRTMPDANAVPGYRIVREIARGGQGAVYEAVQIDTKRRVALKVVELGGSGSRGSQRFELEVELAASLRHPNIVSVYQTVALGNGRQALAMEFVDGVAIDQWAAGISAAAPPSAVGRQNAVRLKVRAMITVCEAVQYAHVNGVIHRDLKPANVLVSADGTVRVVDFGVARRVASAAELTREGSFAGTLAYASPEQVSGQPGKVDTRSDIYSLGLMLHEVLSGRALCDPDRPLTEVIRDIVSTPVPPIGTLPPGNQPADADLEAIVARALAKNPADRYQSAAALAEDLKNWLSGRAVDARQSSTVYVLRKLASRHRFAFAIILAATALLAAFAGAMTLASRRLSAQRTLLASALVSSTIERGRSVGRAGENARAEELIWPELIGTGADLRDPDLLFASPPAPTQAAWALCELYSRQPSLMHISVPQAVEAVRFEQGGSRLRLLHPDGAQSVLTVPAGETVESLPPVLAKPAQRVLLSTDRAAAIMTGPQETVILDLDRGSPVSISHQLLAGDQVWDVSLRRREGEGGGGRFITLSGQGGVRLWTLDPPAPLGALEGPQVQRNRPSFGPDGERVYWGTGDGITSWRSEDGAVIAAWKVPADLWEKSLRAAAFSVRCSPDHRHVVAGFHGSILVFDAANIAAAPRELVPAHRGFVSSVEFSADGRTLLSHGSEQSSKIWDPTTGELRMTFEHRNPIRGRPALSDDGRLVAVCDEADRLRVFEARPRGWFTPLGGFENTVHRAQFSPDGRLVAGASSDGSVRAFRTSDHTLAWSSPGDGSPLSTLCFAPDGQSLALAQHDGLIIVLDTQSSTRERRTLAQVPRFATWLGYSPDGASLVALSGEPWCEVLDARSGASRGRLSGHTDRPIDAVFSRDGSSLFTAGADGRCIAWDIQRRTERFRTEAIGPQMRAIAISPDEKVLATGSDDRKIRLWDASSGRLLRVIEGLRQHTFGLAFHPAGHLLFSCGRDNDMQVWDTRTLREVAVLSGHDGLVMSLAVSPDGRTLATASADRTIGLWDLTRYTTHLQGNEPAWRR